MKIGLKPIVAVNKIDKHDERHVEVVNEVFDLFAALDATDDQLDFPILYGSAKLGWMAPSASVPKQDMAPLFDLVLRHVPAPAVEPPPFRMLATTIEANPYLGRVLTGRIRAGSIRANQPVKVLSRDGRIVEQGRVSKVLAFRGLERQPIEEGFAGDIVAISGLAGATVSDTIAAPEVDTPIAAQPIDPPTLAMHFRINDGPFAGQEGDKVQSRVIRERLYREAEGNVALRISDLPGEADTFEVAGRGELQLAILIETMRREGFELSISRPRVLYRDGPDGREEPYETVVIDVDEEHAGTVVEKMAQRKGEMTDMRPSGGGKTRVTFTAPSRGLIGYHGEFLSDTRGTGIMNRLFERYGPYKGPIAGRQNGVLISMEQGPAVAYALNALEERGILFVSPGEMLYEGMVIGENAKPQDLEVNPLKSKQLTNFRASGKDEGIRLTPPKRMSLEQAIAYIQDDELVEVTPKAIRIRKRYLDPHERKREARKLEAA